MKAVFPLWLRPLNIFQMHGTMCCSKMLISFRSNLLTDNYLCYDARSITDANVLILWGSLSKKLAELACSEFEPTVKNRVIIHIRGCEMRVENEHSSSSLANVLPVNKVFSNCIINPEDAKILVKEARLCLKA